MGLFESPSTRSSANAYGGSSIFVSQARTLRASHQGELSEILDYVHDRNYELSKVEHNARDQTLTIPVALRSTKKSERKSWFLFGGRETTTLGKLVIKRALGFKVVDNARI